MHVHKEGYVLFSDVIDDVGCGISIVLFFMIPFLELLVNGCTDEGISAGTAKLVVILSVLLLVILMVKSFIQKWKAFLEWLASLKARRSQAAKVDVVGDDVGPVEGLA